MEFWLSYNNREETFRLPVPPPDFTVTEGNNINVVNITDVGEISIIGKRKLSTIEITSFFPAQQYSFCQYSGFPAPYECVKIIQRWKESGRPIRLIITDTNVNLALCIETFTYGEKDGTGDVHFTLSLREYRFLDMQNSTVNSLQDTQSRPVEREEPPKTYTVADGDSLWAIAKRFYGDGSKLSGIASQNGITDPGLIYPGQVIVL